MVNPTTREEEEGSLPRQSTLLLGGYCIIKHSSPQEFCPCTRISKEFYLRTQKNDHWKHLQHSCTGFSPSGRGIKVPLSCVQGNKPKPRRSRKVGPGECGPVQSWKASLLHYNCFHSTSVLRWPSVQILSTQQWEDKGKKARIHSVSNNWYIAFTLLWVFHRGPKILERR